MEKLLKQLSDEEASLYILNQVKKEQGFIDELEKEIIDCKKNITRLTNKIKRLQKGKI